MFSDPCTIPAWSDSNFFGNKLMVSKSGLLVGWKPRASESLRRSVDADESVWAAGLRLMRCAV